MVKVSNEPSGLTNLGNTCYLNSSLQTIFHIDDVNNRLKDYTFGGANQANSAFVLSLKSMFQQMSKTRSYNSFYISFFSEDLIPQFAEQQNGIYKQQDAEEAFSQILSSLRSELKIDDVFKITFNTKTQCLAIPEDVTEGFEEAYKLNCHIGVKTNF